MADGIKSVLLLFSCVMVIASVIVVFGITHNEIKCTQTLPILMGCVCFVLLSMAVLMPSSKTLTAMVLVPPILNSKTVDDIPPMLDQLIREWANELRPKGTQEE